MATACDDVLSRLIDSATCPVCYLILVRPRSLPCGHTFCLDCLKGVAEQRQYDVYDYEEYEEVPTGKRDVRFAFVVLVTVK